MKDKQLLMLTLPNSGSTWFAALIAQHTRYNRYAAEYFNPIRNAEHYEALSQEFGCEFVSCYKNIASAGSHRTDALIRRTWGTDDYNFTKEIFSPFKLRMFATHFRVFVLIRDAADSFPPRRLRVWSFYEHAWQAIKDSGIPIEGSHFETKALAAHRVMTQALVSDANDYGVPVLNYRELFTDQGLQEKLQLAIGECNDQLLRAIRGSRVQIPR